MTAKLRWILSSNLYLSPSGYGTQSASLMPRIAELPEFDGGRDDPRFIRSGRKNVAQHAWYGLHGTSLTLDGFQIYPGLYEPYGNDIIHYHVKHFGANILTSLIDIWVLQNIPQKIAPALFLPWFPVDADPIPQRVLDCLQGAHMPLSYSKWGRDLLFKAGVNNTYIPHGVETDIFHVQPREHANNVKRLITGIDNAHLTIMVAANKGYPDRKWHQGQIRAWKEFAKDKPNARLYIHTDPTPAMGGVDFGWLVNNLGIREKVSFPDWYGYSMGYPQSHLADIYNAGDVLIGCSMSEGFGIPIIEAQACGTPVVVTDYSSMPELVRWGHTVRVADYMYMPIGTWHAWPDVADMADKLNSLYAEWEAVGGDWPIERRIALQDVIREEYSWDTIVNDHWAPLMTKLADEAPPLDHRFQIPGVTVGPVRDEVSEFVGAVQEGMEQARPKPKRRVAPLVKKVTE